MRGNVMVNKVKYGLKQVHYAPITEALGVVTYGTPVAIPGAVSIALSAAGETTPFFGDDGQYHTTVSNNGYEGTLEVALIPEIFRTDILGEVVSTTDKVLVENSNANPAEFALLFEFTGDVKGIRHVLYRCKATRPNIESNTKAASTEVKTDILNLIASPLPDGKVKAKTTAETTSAIYDAWYTKVWEKDAVI